MNQPNYTASCDSITVLRSANKQPLTKQWCANGELKSFEPVKQFIAETYQVGNITELSDLLEWLAGQPTRCIIRGALRPKINPERARRTKENFADQLLHTVMFDVDRFVPLAADPLIDPETAIDEAIHTLLPPAFRSASYHYQLSSSFGHPSKPPSGLRCHLWFWLAQARSSAEVKAWARAIGLGAPPPRENDPDPSETDRYGNRKSAVDLALFDEIQPHYTADPVIQRAARDPHHGRRSGFARGADDTVVLPPLAESGRTLNRSAPDISVDSDPVLAALHEQGKVLGPGREKGQYRVTCPWADGHSNGDAEAAYFPAHTGGYSNPAFVCLHNHCDGRGYWELRDWLGENGADTSGFPTAEWLAVDRLKELDGVEFDRQSKITAKQFDARVSTIRKAVDEARKADGLDEPNDDAAARKGQGRAVKLYQPEPWPEPVDGASVLNEAYAAIRRFVVVTEEEAIVCALWAAHTHVFDVFSNTPRLAISAPHEECAKTLLGTYVVGGMVPRPEPVELMKSAPFFRLAESIKPVFLISEVDTFIKEDSELLAAINNGWEPHGGVTRCVGEGANLEVRHFSTHTPLCLDGIKLHKKLPPTTLGRAHIINMERATEAELADITNFDKRPWSSHTTELREIGRRFARWCTDYRDALAGTEADLPEDVVARRADKWRPLFVLADCAGGDWPRLVRKACAVENPPPQRTTSLQLLSDLCAVFRPEEKSLHTGELIRRLCDEIEESYWESYNFRARDFDRWIKPRQLSNLLKDYGIQPITVKIDGKNLKGYHRKPIEMAHDRYIYARPPQPPVLAVTRNSARHEALSREFPAVTGKGEVTARTGGDLA